MNQSFLFFELIGVFIVHWLILEPQTNVVVEQFGAENIPLLSGRLVKRQLDLTDFMNSMNLFTLLSRYTFDAGVLMFESGTGLNF